MCFVCVQCQDDAAAGWQLSNCMSQLFQNDFHFVNSHPSVRHTVQDDVWRCRLFACLKLISVDHGLVDEHDLRQNLLDGNVVTDQCHMRKGASEDTFGNVMAQTCWVAFSFSRRVHQVAAMRRGLVQPDTSLIHIHCHGGFIGWYMSVKKVRPSPISQRLKFQKKRSTGKKKGTELWSPIWYQPVSEARNHDHIVVPVLGTVGTQICSELELK